MAYDKCIGRLIAAAGRQLSDDEVRGIFERIHKAALDIKAGRADADDVGLGKKLEKQLGVGRTGDLLIQEAAARAAKEMEYEAALVARRANLQMIKLAARQGDFEAVRARGFDSLQAVERVVRRDYTGRTNVESLEQRVRGVESDLLRRLTPMWDALGDDFLGFFQDRQKLLTLVRALRGEKTGEALADQGAKAFHDVAEEARQAFNAAGGDIGRLDDWGMPQHHSQENVARAAQILSKGDPADPAANRAAWTDYMVPRMMKTAAQGRHYIDEITGQPWTEVRMREFLSAAWDTIATDGINSLEPGRLRGAGGARARRNAEHRQIHFASADDVIEYWNTFGNKTAVEIMHGHVNQMAKDIAFIEHFGPNPDMTYQTLRDIAERTETAKDPRKTPDLKGRLDRMDELWNYAAGRTNISQNTQLSAVADGVAQLNVAGKLGGAMFASLFGDKVMYEAVSHLNDVPMLQRWRTELATLNPLNSSDRRALLQQGLMLENIRSGLLRFYDDLGTRTGAGGFRATTGKFANAIMRMSGMTVINDFRKGSFGLGLYHAIGGEIASGKGWDALAQSDVRTLRNYGITKADWDTWRLAELGEFRMGSQRVKNVLTPEAISRIPDEKIIAAAPAKVTATKAAYDTQIAELTGRNFKDQQRMAGRKQGFADLQNRINRAVKEFAGNKQKKAAQTIGDLDSRVDEALGDLADVRESTAEGVGVVRAEFDQAVSDAQQIGVLRQRMRGLASDARAAIGKKAGNARERIEAYRDSFTTAKGWRWTDPWMKSKLEKFHGIQDNINRVVREYAEGKFEGLAERMEVLQGRADDLLNDTMANRQSAAEAMRASVNAVDQAARSGSEFGGLRERIRVAARDAQRAIETKASDAGERIEAVRESLMEYEGEVTNRLDRRQAVINRLTKERDAALAALPKQLRREAIVKLLGAVNTESDFAVVTPGWKERSLFYASLKRGTAVGEIARSALQFKSFPWAFFQRSLDAIANAETPAGKAAMTAWLLMATTAAGAMIINTREILSGKDPRRMMDQRDWYKFWGQAFLQGGALGIYGDLLYGITGTRYGSGAIEAFSGPTLGPLLSMGIVDPLKAIKAKVEGKETHLVARELRNLKGFIPGNNLWYTKAATEHLVWQRVMDSLSPGYLAAIRKRHLREYKQDWWWRPGEVTPERGPEFGVMFER